MSTSDLRDALRAVSGVADAEVTERAGEAPIIRVWLDGSRPGAEVEHDIDVVISERGYQGSFRSPEAKAARDDANGRRAGLGRGLDTLIPVANEESAPAHLQEVGSGVAALDSPTGDAVGKAIPTVNSL